MSLGEHVITHSVANIISMTTELYRVMFREMAKLQGDDAQCQNRQAVLGVYINNFKSVTGKMVSKPLLFKYYSIYISYRFSVLLSFLYLTCYAIC